MSWNPLTETGRQTINAYKREYRKRPEVRAKERERNARYRAANLERIRERDREHARAKRAQTPGSGHVTPLNCPASGCGKFLSNWGSTGHFDGVRDWEQCWGTCKVHGYQEWRMG